MAARKHETFLKALETLRANYHVCTVFIDACRLGVPQVRKRIFVIGCRTDGDDIAVVTQMQAFISKCKTMMRENPACTIEQHIPEMRNKTLFVLPRRKDAQSVFEMTRPSPTVRSMILGRPIPSLQEVRQNAGPISEAVVPDKELALKLSGFPNDFKMGNEKVSSAVQIGNTVVPAAAALVAEFAKSLIPLAGPGGSPGMSLTATYALKPCRFG